MDIKETRIEKLKRRKKEDREKAFRYLILFFIMLIFILSLNKVEISMNKLMQIESKGIKGLLLERIIKFKTIISKYFKAR